MHCVKSVRIWSYSGPYFPALGLNTEIKSKLTESKLTLYKVRIYEFCLNVVKYGPENSNCGRFSPSDICSGMKKLFKDSLVFFLEIAPLHTY